MKALAMCALADIDPVGVMHAAPAERDLLLLVAAEVHKMNADAQKKAKK